MKTSTKPGGVIAAGHPQTVRAAAIILEEGGNAFDAVLAAAFASCVAEPVLASLGGGGFLLARQGRLLRVPVLLGEARPASYEIRVKGSGFSARQLKRLQSWLGQSLQTK